MREEQKHSGLGVVQNFTIDFKSLFMELLDKAIVIILGGLATVLATLLLTSTIIDLNYESVTKIYIKPQENGSNSSYVSLEVGSLLTTDYKEMIVGRDILEDTIMTFDIDSTYEKFVHKISVENPIDTRILEISVTDKDPFLARNLAIYIRDKAIDEITGKMGNEGISVIEQANLPTRTVISKKLIAVIMGILTMFLIAVVVIIRFLLSDMIVTTDDFEKYFDIPILGTIAFEKGRG